MKIRSFADRLVAAAGKRERLRILKSATNREYLGIARRIKSICYEVWTTAPATARRAAKALSTLSEIDSNVEIAALSDWVSAIAELTHGRFENAVALLDTSSSQFLKVGMELDAAQTGVAKVVVLGLCGDYEAALETGRRVLEIFEKHDDQLAAGKVEKNLGNIVARQNGILAAEKYYLSAMARFRTAGDAAELAMCETNLADNFADLNDFVEAERYYADALCHARTAGLDFVEAEIEASLGNLALLRGRYGDALRHLEIARRKFESQRVVHRTVVADLEIAGIYQSLNLLDEAIGIYSRTARRLRRLGLQGDEARARLRFGEALGALREFDRARKELRRSALLFELEGNRAGLAEVRIAEANLARIGGNAELSLRTIDAAARIIRGSENLRLRISADWIRGESLKELGRLGSAERALDRARRGASESEDVSLLRTCTNSLGDLALRREDLAAAETYFRKAVEIAETQRSPLAGEAFRMAFLANKLGPYDNLAKIYQRRGDLELSFQMIERSRARTLAENIGVKPVATNETETSGLRGKLENLREELNWFYGRLARAGRDEAPALLDQAKTREQQIAETLRQIESTESRVPDGRIADFDVSELKNALGENQCIVEYFERDGGLGAFVVTHSAVSVVEGLACIDQVFALLEQLRFQFGTFRYGSDAVKRFAGELKSRADAVLQELYEQLVAPLGELIGERDLVIVPAGPAHYVPFAALRHGDRYLIQSREVVLAPSAEVWRKLRSMPRSNGNETLLVGFADEKIPLVEQEISDLREMIPQATILTGADASFSAFRAAAPRADILHIACHGQFRPENPEYSSLHLADGFVTVHDLCRQNLRARLVTLSACETGLNAVYAGNEIIGLARGFFAAGASSLVLSLWTVNDEATSHLMTHFYKRFLSGATPAAALRDAQLEFVGKGEHPYLWSPFAAIGK